MTTTTRDNYEQLSYRGKRSQWQGKHSQLINDAVATRQLYDYEAGARVCLDLTTGATITLPTPYPGMEFEFFVTVSATSSGVYKIITAAATQFLLGAVTIGTIATASAGSFAADGTTIVAINMDATTKGGLAGGYLKLVALSTTVWMISGFLIGSGTIVTGFATT